MPFLKPPEPRLKASTKKAVLIALLCASSLALLAAGGWLLYFQSKFAVYHDAAYHFSIKYPKTWKVLVAPRAGVAVAFISPKENALDTLQENFNVTVQTVPPALATLSTFSATIKKQMMAVFSSNLKITQDRAMQWDWHQGREMVFDAPTPDHLRMVNAWTIVNDQAYILTFLGDMHKWPQYGPLAKEMVRSFHLK